METVSTALIALPGGHGDFFGPEIVRRVRAFLERTFYDPSVDVPSAPIAFSAPGA